MFNVYSDKAGNGQVVEWRFQERLEVCFTQSYNIYVS